MEVRLSELVGADEKPIWWRVAAATLNLTHDGLKKLSDKAGFPAHYVKIIPESCKHTSYKVRVCYPSELLVFRAIRYPEFGQTVTIPDGVWERRQPAGSIVDVGGFQRGDPGGVSQAGVGEAGVVVRGAGDAALRASGDGPGFEDGTGLAGPVGSGAECGAGLGDAGPTGETDGDDCPQAGTAGVDATRYESDADNHY